MHLGENKIIHQDVGGWRWLPTQKYAKTITNAGALLTPMQVFQVLEHFLQKLFHFPIYFGLLSQFSEES